MEKLLDAEAARAILGIGRVTLWRLTKAGELPVVRIGDRVLYRPRDLDEFIAARVRPRAPIGEAVETTTTR